MFRWRGQEELQHQQFLRCFGSFCADQVALQEFPTGLENCFPAATFVLLFQGLSWHKALVPLPI